MKTGTEILQSLPKQPSPKREAAIRQLILDGNYAPISWIAVPVSYNGHKGTLSVMSDSLRLGTAADSFRIAATAQTAQLTADDFNEDEGRDDVTMPTTHMVDVAWKAANAVQYSACTQSVDVPIDAEANPPGPMNLAHMQRIKTHHDAIEQKRDGRCGIINNFKYWVLTNKYGKRPTSAANYFFADSRAPYLSASGIRMWQTLGLRHNALHVDYSQLLWYVKSTMIVDGVERSVEEVGSDPELCGLVSSEGPLRFWRIPAVARDDGEPVPLPEAPPAPTERLRFDRLLRLTDPWMRGDDIKKWQRVLGVGVDGVFGPRTSSRTRSWQRDHGLIPDGVVGPATVAKANEVAAHREDAGADPTDDLIDDFMQAINYRPANRTDIRWIVIHTMEAPEKGSTAEAVSRWAAGANAPQASWHFAVDNDSIVQCVREQDVAWHAKQANRYGIGIEHAGYARQTAEEWNDEFSQEMLERSARLSAYLAKKYDIPFRHLTLEQYLNGEKGFIEHADVTRAHNTPGGHQDPGKNYPWDEYLQMARAA
jgi:N-acetyl-anhydromuramyl-L-alanine amidase AmpD